MADRDRPGMRSCFIICRIRMPILRSKPIQALEHPTFHKMISIAARATASGVTIPNRKSTRGEIMAMFRTQMTQLRNRFNVCFLQRRCNVSY
jgi:hypothetical protein